MSEAWIGLLSSIVVAALSLIGVILTNKASTRDMMAQLKELLHAEQMQESDALDAFLRDDG